MNLSLKILVAMLFGASNAIDFNITEQVGALYDGLLNGYNEPSKLDIWMDKFSDNTINTEALKLKTQNTFFKLNNLVYQECNVIKHYNDLSADYKCQFTFEKMTPIDGKKKCTITTGSKGHIQFDSVGDKIVQFRLLNSRVTFTDCKSSKKKINDRVRRLQQQQQQQQQNPQIPITPPPKVTTTTEAPTPTPDCYDSKGIRVPCTPKPTTPDTCYTIEENPCTYSNINAGKFYFPSCNSCCSFIQCDEFGQAYEMPCSEGTFWDQNLLTCNHNNGECTSNECTTHTEAPSTTPKTTEYTPDIDMCYTTDNIYNPCTSQNRALGLYYFPSCTSCCNFIQCDDFGVAYDRECSPGTFWDPRVNTCNHIRYHNGQCKDDDKCINKPTTLIPTTPKPTTTTKIPCEGKGCYDTTTRTPTTPKPTTPEPTTPEPTTPEPTPCYGKGCRTTTRKPTTPKPTTPEPTTTTKRPCNGKNCQHPHSKGGKGGSKSRSRSKSRGKGGKAPCNDKQQQQQNVY